jgi:hypothetical protein
VCRVALRALGYVGFLVVLLLKMMATASSVAAQTDGAAERLVLAFYQAGYSWETWSAELCDEPQFLYTSADASAVDRHLRQAQSAGLDALVHLWLGPHLETNTTEPNLALLLRQAASTEVAVAVAMDMTTADHLVTGNEVAEALMYLRDEHQSKPAYLRIDGRPVVFFLGQDRLSLGSWTAVRNRVDPARGMVWIAEADDVMSLEVFDGLYLYEIADHASGDLLTPSNLNRWGEEIRRWEGGQRYWVATVFPGYDEGYLMDPDPDRDEDDTPIVRSRDSGATYRESWAAADASDPDWIVIRSYNEWASCTHVEPSLLYGNRYLDLTQELASQYRRPVAPTPVLTPTATPTLTPTVTLTPTAVVTAPTAILTGTLTPTPTVTPTMTLVPTATPFRLATPTPTLAPEAIQTREVAGVLDPSTSVPPTRPGRPITAMTPTSMPRLPVEGASPRRCTLLPLWVTVAVVIGWRQRSRSRS